MEKLAIEGGVPLTGEVAISGAKNAALPILCAALLTAEPLTIGNVPHLRDVTTMLSLLGQMGVKTTLDDKNGIALNAASLNKPEAPYDMVKTMRASVLVLGPLVARFGEAMVSLPGGCAIGTRPVNLHLAALKELGAEIAIEDGYINARAPKGLKGAVVRFPTVTVGPDAFVNAGGTVAFSQSSSDPDGDALRSVVGRGPVSTGSAWLFGYGLTQAFPASVPFTAWASVAGWSGAADRRASRATTGAHNTRSAITCGSVM